MGKPSRAMRPSQAGPLAALRALSRSGRKPLAHLGARLVLVDHRSNNAAADTERHMNPLFDAIDFPTTPENLRTLTYSVLIIGYTALIIIARYIWMGRAERARIRDRLYEIEYAMHWLTGGDGPSHMNRADLAYHAELQAEHDRLTAQLRA